MSTMPAGNTPQNNNAAGLAATATVPPTLPALVVPGMLPGGVIPTALLFADLTVILTLPWRFPAELGETDYFVVIWHVLGSVPFDLPAIALPGPILPSQFPLQLRIPQAYFLNNAVVEISYRIHNLFEDSPTFEMSFPVVVTFDRRPPGENEVLKAPVSTLNPIREVDLSGNLTLDIVVPGDYSGRAPNDSILLYFGATNSFPTGLPVHVQVFVSSTGVMTLTVSVLEFRKFSNFPIIYCFYKVRDAAGNVSQFSLVGSVALDLRSLPANLPLPEIPAFDFDKLITREDARNIVSFTVRRYDNWSAGDLCIAELAGIKLPPVPVNSLPFTSTLPWPALIANGSHLQRTDNVPFRYYIQQPTDLVGPGERSPLTLLSMDFTVHGRDHNLAPALLNPLLDLLNIFGAVSNTANVLDTRDINQPVRAEVRLSGSPKVGDILSLFWPGQATAVATYTVRPGDTSGTIVIFSPIPWSVIQAGGSNATTLVNYRTDNGVNQQLSADRSVSVVITPLINFPRATFPQSLQHPNKFLNCATQPPIWLGIQVLVIPGPNVLVVGDIIVLAWQGFLNYPDKNPIPSTAATFSQVWGANQTSCNFLVDKYDQLIRPLSDFAGGSAKYSVLRNGIPIGTSAVAYVQIDRKYAGSGKYCGPGGIGPLEK